MPDSVRAAARVYREESDRIEMFTSRCLKKPWAARDCPKSPERFLRFEQYAGLYRVSTANKWRIALCGKKTS